MEHIVTSEGSATEFVVAARVNLTISTNGPKLAEGEARFQLRQHGFEVISAKGRHLQADNYGVEAEINITVLADGPRDASDVARKKLEELNIRVISVAKGTYA